MAKYRKRPEIVEAEVYKPGMEDSRDNCDKKCPYLFDESVDCPICDRGIPYLNVLGSKCYISPGDYIVTGVKSERYPCKPDIFCMTYEPVEAKEGQG